MHRLIPFLSLALALALLAAPASVHAQPVGTTSAAWPGIERVGVPAVRTRGWGAAATGGWGVTEAQADQSGANHRLAGSLALAGAPLPWLELGLRLDGRYDIHPADEEGSDAGGVGEPRGMLRLGLRSGDLVYGLDSVVWLLGSDAPSVTWDATTVDLRGLVGYAPTDGNLTIAGYAGWRFDQSAQSEEAPEQLRVGDRVGIGLSESDALLLGAGASYRVGEWELLGEVTADLLVGQDSPAVGESPFRILGGTRFWATPQLGLFAALEGTPSGRPSVQPDAPLAPIEPRLTVLLGLRYQRSVTTAAEPPPDTAPPPPPTPPVTPPSPPQTAQPPPPTEPKLERIAGRIVDESGAPVPDAAVTLLRDEQKTKTRTATDGSFEFSVPAPAGGQITVESAGFDPVQQTVGDRSSGLELVLRPAVPAGELKGLIRGLDGAPIQATVTVAGTDLRLETDSEGKFTSPVPPGKYVVRIEAEGFASQTRRVAIENRGVTVLNVDLRQK